jgi:hypothetical protein
MAFRNSRRDFDPRMLFSSRAIDIPYFLSLLRPSLPRPSRRQEKCGAAIFVATPHTFSHAQLCSAPRR